MKEKAVVKQETPEKEEHKKGREEVFIKYGFIALGAILVVCVVAFAIISLLPTNIISIGDNKVSEEEFDYHYYEQTNMLFAQVQPYYPDLTLEMFMISEYQNGLTYHEFAKQLALERISDLYILMDMVEQENYVYDKAELEDSKATFKSSFDEYAASQDMTLDEASKQLYNCKFDIVMEIYEKTWISSKFEDDKILEFQGLVTDEETKEYYDAFAEDLDKVTLKQLFIATYDTATQSYYSDEDYEDAKSRAGLLLEQVVAGDDFDNLILLYSEDPAASDTLGEYVSKKSEIGLPELEEWAFDEDRAVGDIEIVETQIGFHIVRYDGRTDYEEAIDDVKYNIAYGQMLSIMSERKSLPAYEIGYYDAFTRY